jgi:hypothetical protein
VPDIGVQYTLTTPGGTINFNDGSANQYYLSTVGGLDGPTIRAPIDDRPQTDGGIVHDFFAGPRHITFEGVLLIQSTHIMNSVVQIRNTMEDNLRTAVVSLLRADGTLAWTPQGKSARSLTVRHDVPLDFTNIENYLLLQFHFGLVAANPYW